MKTIKTLAAFLIVGAAVFIVIPGLLSFMASLLRLALIIVIAGGACLALAHARTKAKRLVGSKEKTPAVTADANQNSAEANHVST
jgi:drug/metabolite transporter (DMT)-like permease